MFTLAKNEELGHLVLLALSSNERASGQDHFDEDDGDFLEEFSVGHDGGEDDLNALEELGVSISGCCGPDDEQNHYPVIPFTSSKLFVQGSSFDLSSFNSMTKEALEEIAELLGCEIVATPNVLLLVSLNDAELCYRPRRRGPTQCGKAFRLTKQVRTRNRWVAELLDEIR